MRIHICWAPPYVGARFLCTAAGGVSVCGNCLGLQIIMISVKPKCDVIYSRVGRELCVNSADFLIKDWRLSVSYFKDEHKEQTQSPTPTRSVWTITHNIKDAWISERLIAPIFKA